MNKIGIVIPTAFSRPEYLPLAYDSIAQQAGNFELKILVGCPQEKLNEVKASLPENAEVIAESKFGGLASKLGTMLGSLSECDYIAWLGDDDLLTPDALQRSLEVLEANSDVVMTYGGCDYIDAEGKVLFTNSSGPWAARILSFGPQLIPQPGSVMRTSAFLATNGLSNEFALAFDFDLFLKLKKQGRLSFIDSTLAQFRWHPTSLSVKRRMRSALEASRVRRKHYQGLAKMVWFIWEPWVILATWFAGKLVSLRTR